MAANHRIYLGQSTFSKCLKTGQYELWSMWDDTYKVGDEALIIERCVNTQVEAVCLGIKKQPRDHSYLFVFGLVVGAVKI